jgi:hypothetical protein
VDGRVEVVWEVKGPSRMKGVARGVVMVKVAAAQWPWVEFFLVWFDGSGWHAQRVLA